MRVVITGAAGFLGNALAHHISKYPMESILGLDLRFPPHKKYPFETHAVDSASLPDMVAAFRPDIVFHFAAQSGIPDCRDNPLNAFTTNVAVTFSLLERLRSLTTATLPRIILAGSAEEYGEGQNRQPEDGAHPRNMYAATKAAATMLALGHAKQYGMRTQVVRFANLYGPEQKAPKFIPLVIDRLLAKQDVELHNYGLVEKDWLFVDDAVRCLAKLACLNEPSGGIINLPGAERATLSYVSDLIASELDIAAPLPNMRYRSYVRCVPSPSHGTQAFMERDTRFRAVIGLARGISATVRHTLVARKGT